MAKVTGIGTLTYFSSDSETFIGLTEMEAKEPTPEELAALAAKERAEIIDRCAKSGHTKSLTEDDRAKVANEPEFLELCESERRQAKDSMLARNAQRIKELGGKLKTGETLEEYDTRVAKEKK